MPWFREASAAGRPRLEGRTERALARSQPKMRIGVELSGIYIERD
jgi:hypothetical protein